MGKEHFVEHLQGGHTVIGIAFGSTKPYDNSLKNRKLTELYIKQIINTWRSISANFQYV
jgi:hypothetical protein